MSEIEFEDEISDIDDTYSKLVNNHSLKNSSIIRRPYGQLAVRLSWKNPNGLCKNIISTINTDDSIMEFESNSWKDTKSGSEVYRRWEHFSDISPVEIGSDRWQQEIEGAIVHAYNQVHQISNENELGEPVKLDLDPSDVEILEL